MNRKVNICLSIELFYCYFNKNILHWVLYATVMQVPCDWVAQMNAIRWRTPCDYADGVSWCQPPILDVTHTFYMLLSETSFFAKTHLSVVKVLNSPNGRGKPVGRFTLLKRGLRSSLPIARFSNNVSVSS